jgi:hypothetical protein
VILSKDNMNIEDLRIKIKAFKASYSRILKEKPETKIYFLFENGLENVAYTPDEIPDPEIILKEMDGPESLTLKIFINDILKVTKVLYQKETKEIVKEEPREMTKDSKFLEEIVKQMAEGQRQFLGSVQEQYNSLYKNLESGIKTQLEYQQNLSQNLTKDFKDILEGIQNNSVKHVSEIQKTFENQIVKVKEDMDKSLRFEQERASTMHKLETDFIQKNNDLAIQKLTYEFNSQIEKSAIPDEKMSFKDKVELVKEVLPDFLTSVKEGLSLVRQFKDISVKEVS